MANELHCNKWQQDCDTLLAVPNATQQTPTEHMVARIASPFSKEMLTA